VFLVESFSLSPAITWYHTKNYACNSWGCFWGKFSNTPLPSYAAWDFYYDALTFKPENPFLAKPLVDMRGSTLTYREVRIL
jgi:hypothetical protein